MRGLGSAPADWQWPTSCCPQKGFPLATSLVTNFCTYPEPTSRARPRAPPISPSPKPAPRSRRSSWLRSAKAEKAIAEFAALVDRLTTLADEKAKTEKAIAAFAALAERLDALAAERARPWCRRLVGG